MRRFTLLCAAVAALLAVPAAAGAAYAPKLDIQVTPTNHPGGQIALRSIVTQADTEEPSKAARVHFPVGIAFNIAALQRKETCQPAQRDAKACPEGSRIGTATAEAPVVGTLTGGVHLGPAASIYIFLRNPTLALLGKEPPPITGRTEFRADGGTDTVLDDLPTDITATRFELAIDGAPNGVLNVGETSCGPLRFSGDFTSKSGVKVTASDTVTFTGCRPPNVELDNARLIPTRVRRGHFARLRYTINRAAQMEITVRKLGKRKILARKRYSTGANPGNVAVGTRKLALGRYVVTLRATADGRTDSRSFVMRVLAPRRRR